MSRWCRACSTTSPRPIVELIIDSGIRRGVDIVKAVALGAQAAGVARPALFGAAVGGDAGALCAIDILLDEAKRAMVLCGTPNVEAIRTGDVIAPLASN